MSNSRYRNRNNRRDEQRDEPASRGRRQRSHSFSPPRELFTNKNRDLRISLRQQRDSRSRSPNNGEGEYHFTGGRQYSPSENFRNDNDPREDEQQQRFYHEEEVEHPDRVYRQSNSHRRNFRSRSREFEADYRREPQQRGGFVPQNRDHASRGSRFSPPEPLMNARPFVSPQAAEQPQQVIHQQQAVIYQKEVIEAGPVLYTNDVSPFGDRSNSRHSGVSAAQKPEVLWQPPEEVIVIADNEPEEQMIEEEKLTAADIPNFDPDNKALDSRQFISIIDEIASVNKWTEEEIKYNFITHLSGNAKTWHINSNRMMNPWNNLKRSFNNTFPPEMDYCKHLQAMLNRTKHQEETVKNYVMHKTVLLNMADISGRRAVACLIAGLQNEDVKQAAYLKNFGTTEELLDYLDEMNKEKEKEVANNNPRNKTLMNIISNVQEQPILIPQLMQQLQAKSTPSPKQQQADATKLVTVDFCFSCMAEGHLARDCPLIHPQQQAAQVQVQAQANRTIIQKHCIEVSINGIVFTGYNDPNSSSVTMRVDDAKHANVQFKRHITCIRGFGNASVTALGEARVIIRVDKVMLSFPVMIVPNAAQDFPVVIGKSFRAHPDVRYVEGELGISFTQIHAKELQLQQNSSFTANERLMASFNSSGAVTKGRGGGNRGGGGAGGGDGRGQQKQRRDQDRMPNRQNNQIDKQRRRY